MYRAYLTTEIGKELVAVKTVKSKIIISFSLSNVTQTYTIINSRSTFFSIFNFYKLSHTIFSMLPALFSNDDVERLAKEVSTMLMLEHTNVMSLRGVCVSAESPLLIMPFMNNGSVLEFIKHHKDILCVSIDSPVRLLYLWWNPSLMTPLKQGYLYNKDTFYFPKCSSKPLKCRHYFLQC